MSFVDRNICRVVGAAEEVGGLSVVKKCNAKADPIVCFVGLTDCGLTKPLADRVFLTSFPLILLLILVDWSSLPRISRHSRVVKLDEE